MSPYELVVGLRYTGAPSGRNHFISFISMTSMVGIALGVAALIVVLSVMNGFQKELRTRILGVASHVQITGLPTLQNERQIAALRRSNPHVKAAAPYVAGQAMLSTGDVSAAALVRGVDPARENGWPTSARTCASGAGRPASRANSASCSVGAGPRARRDAAATRSC